MGRVKETVINLCANFLTSINIVTDSLKSCKITSEEIKTRCLDVCDKGGITCLDSCHVRVAESIRIGQNGTPLYRYESHDIQTDVTNLSTFITTHLNYQIVGNVATVFVQGVTGTVPTGIANIPNILIHLPDPLISVINQGIIPRDPITVINTTTSGTGLSLGMVHYALLGNKGFLVVYPSLYETNSTTAFSGIVGFRTFSYSYAITSSGALKEAELRGLVPIEFKRSRSDEFVRRNRFARFGELQF